MAVQCGIQPPASAHPAPTCSPPWPHLRHSGPRPSRHGLVSMSWLLLVLASLRGPSSPRVSSMPRSQHFPSLLCWVLSTVISSYFKGFFLHNRHSVNLLTYSSFNLRTSTVISSGRNRSERVRTRPPASIQALDSRGGASNPEAAASFYSLSCPLPSPPFHFQFYE